MILDVNKRENLGFKLTGGGIGGCGIIIINRKKLSKEFLLSLDEKVKQEGFDLIISKPESNGLTFKSFMI